MITENIQPILMVTGAMTAGATIGFFLFPRSLLQRVFRVKEPGPALTLVTMSLGLAGSLVGALLVWAAFAPSVRVPVVLLALSEKVIFAGSVFLGRLKKFGLVKVAAVGDSFMAVLYGGYLLGF
jgi:hypothetical protein